MIDADDLQLLTKSFEAAMAAGGEQAALDRSLHELGWPELLEAAPLQGAAATFSVAGASGAAPTLLDDVLAAALGLPVSLDLAVVLPLPQQAVPASSIVDGRLQLAGLVSARIDTATRVVVPVADGDAVRCVEVPAAAVAAPARDALDAAAPIRRITPDALALASARALDAGSWDEAVSAARVALAHQLVGAARHMLDLARTHAIDRVQFGRPVASFQALRHKLSETLATIEAAAAVADAAVLAPDPLTSMVAKSLAGKAVRVASTHVQQVLAGIGFTTEHTFHLWLKRTMVLEPLFGSARTLPAEIGRALLAHGGAPRLIEL